MTHGLGPGKPGLRASKPITPPYVENNYRIEVKITFVLIAYLVLLCEFFWEFSIFQFCRPLVDIYWHPLLSLLMYDTVNGNVPSYLSDLFSNVRENNPYKSMLRNTEYNVVLDHVPKTECYKGSFSYRGGMLWNSLPNDIKASESKAIFKRKLASRQANCWLHFTTFYYLYIFLVWLYSIYFCFYTAFM